MNDRPSLKEFIWSMLPSLVAAVIYSCITKIYEKTLELTEGQTLELRVQDYLEFAASFSTLYAMIAITFMYITVRVTLDIGKKIIYKLNSGTHAQRAGLLGEVDLFNIPEDRVERVTILKKDSEKMRKIITEHIGLDRASNMIFVGATGYAAFNEKYGELYEIFKDANIPIKVAIMDPDDSNIQTLQRRAQDLRVSADEYRGRILDFLQIAMDRGGDIQICLYSKYPAWRVISATNCSLVQLYTAQKGQFSTKFIFNNVSSDQVKLPDSMHDYFRRLAESYFDPGIGRGRIIRQNEINSVIVKTKNQMGLPV